MFTKLADLAVYDLAGLDASSKFGQAVQFFVMDITKIFTMLIVLLFLIGILRSYIDSEQIKKWLEGRNKWVAYFLAAVLGAVTPFCSCSSIPLFIGFIAAGIPFGVTMAFLITSPMVNEVAVILFGQNIGWEFSAVYTITGMFIGILGGAVIDFLKLERWIEPSAFAPQKKCACTCSSENTEEVESKYPHINYGWEEAKFILRKIWIYVVIGVGLGAGMHGYVPQGWVTSHVGADNLFAVPLAVLAGVPLYANVTGLVPVAEVFIDKGVPVGTTLAFIMATATLSLPEIIILRNVLKPQMIAFFVGFLSVAFIIVGYVFNAVF